MEGGNTMTLEEFLELYDNWNGYTVINCADLSLYARVLTHRIHNGNYKKILTCKVLAFGFYDGELCVRINY